MAGRLRNGEAAALASTIVAADVAAVEAVVIEGRSAMGTIEFAIGRNMRKDQRMIGRYI